MFGECVSVDLKVWLWLGVVNLLLNGKAEEGRKDSIIFFWLDSVTFTRQISKMADTHWGGFLGYQLGLLLLAILSSPRSRFAEHKLLPYVGLTRHLVGHHSRSLPSDTLFFF